ncbi:unnamed protein product [Brassica rapa]|uniref:Uncharacterized protein n=1 Tax=Brassica campestris TaxID=3711 RepID=A0A8D9DCR8_BRACM|nr:unnamed protein product [Brassica rapa]
MGQSTCTSGQVRLGQLIHRESLESLLLHSLSLFLKS